MKVVETNSKGESRELLLKEYFLNAFLIGLLKRVGEEAGNFSRRPETAELVPIPVENR